MQMLTAPCPTYKQRKKYCVATLASVPTITSATFIVLHSRIARCSRCTTTQSHVLSQEDAHNRTLKHLLKARSMSEHFPTAEPMAKALSNACTLSHNAKTAAAQRSKSRVAAAINLDTVSRLLFILVRQASKKRSSSAKGTASNLISNIRRPSSRLARSFSCASCHFASRIRCFGSGLAGGVRRLSRNDLRLLHCQGSLLCTGLLANHYNVGIGIKVDPRCGQLAQIPAQTLGTRFERCIGQSTRYHTANYRHDLAYALCERLLCQVHAQHSQNLLHGRIEKRLSKRLTLDSFSDTLLRDIGCKLSNAVRHAAVAVRHAPTSSIMPMSTMSFMSVSSSTSSSGLRNVCQP